TEPAERTAAVDDGPRRSRRTVQSVPRPALRELWLRFPAVAGPRGHGPGRRGLPRGDGGGQAAILPAGLSELPHGCSSVGSPRGAPWWLPSPWSSEWVSQSAEPMSAIPPAR